MLLNKKLSLSRFEVKLVTYQYHNYFFKKLFLEQISLPFFSLVHFGKEPPDVALGEAELLGQGRGACAFGSAAQEGAVPGLAQGVGAAGDAGQVVAAVDRGQGAGGDYLPSVPR